MKRFLNILFGIIVLSAMAFAIYFVSLKQKDVKVSKMEIDIQYAGPDIFLKKEDIKKIVEENIGDVFSKNIVELEIKKIESQIANNPYVSKVNVFTSLNGKLMIDILQRQPIARISTLKGSFYIDTNGDILPLNSQYVSRVMLVNGLLKNYSYMDLEGKNIQEIEGENNLKDIYYLANYIYQNKFLKALTEQIYVNRNKEFEIVPKIGKQLILLGGITHLDDKFRKLQLFYKHGITLRGWDRYKLINLKYKNQVVCTKRI